MIYVSKEKSIIKIEGSKDECTSDLYNVLKGYIRSGFTAIELLKLLLDADRAAGWVGDADDPGE